MIRRHPVWAVVAAWVAYAALFGPGHASPANDMFAAVALGPALFTAHLLGFRGARWIILFIPLQTLLFLANDHTIGWDMFAGSEGLFGMLSIPLVALYAGNSSDMHRRLEALHDDRDRFIAAVAHDIKTPLTGVIGLSLALADDPALSDEPRELAGLIASEAQVATDVIEDLSVTALRNSGMFRTHPEGFLLADEVVAAAKRIEGVTVDVVSGIEVWADRKRVRQILNNLVSNAERHGAPPIEMRVDSLGDMAFVEISDRGPGISDKHLDSLFEPFGMVGVSGHVESTGLGLSSSRVLAMLMHGNLAYRGDSAGSTFVLSLPIRTDDHALGTTTTSDAIT